MGQTKHKSLREKFEEEYTATVEPCDNKQGFKIKYVYYGNWYLWNVPEEQLKALKRKILLLSLLDAVLFILAAALPSDVNAYRLVAFPGIAALLALMLKWIGIFQFLFAKYRTTKSTFEDVGRRIRVWSVIQIAGAALSFAGCIYYIAAYGFLTTRCVTALFYALSAVVSGIVLHIFRKIPGKVEKNAILDHVTRATPEMENDKEKKGEGHE